MKIWGSLPGWPMASPLKILALSALLFLFSTFSPSIPRSELPPYSKQKLTDLFPHTGEETYFLLYRVSEPWPRAVELTGSPGVWRVSSCKHAVFFLLCQRAPSEAADPAGARGRGVRDPPVPREDLWGTAGGRGCEVLLSVVCWLVFPLSPSYVLTAHFLSPIPHFFLLSPQSLPSTFNDSPWFQGRWKQH